MAVAKEVWTANIYAGSVGLGIYWSTNLSSGSPNWNKVASLPSATFGLNNIYITHYGTRLYVVGTNPDDSGHYEIWYSDNPRAGSPAWTKILETTVTSLGGGNFIDGIDQDTFPDRALAIDPDTGTLAGMFRSGGLDQTLYGEYSNGAWTFTTGRYWEGAYGSTGVFDFRIAMKNQGGGGWEVYHPPSTVVDEVITNVDPYGLWRSRTSARTMLKDRSGTDAQLRTLISGGTGFSYNMTTYSSPSCLLGAFDGTEVLLVTYDGYFIRSSDGSTADQTSVWSSRTNRRHYAVDLDTEGGGLLVWMTKPPTGQECIRGSTNGGASWSDYAGDMLSAFATDGLFEPSSIRLTYEAIDFTNAQRLTQSLVSADGVGLDAKTDGAIATFSEVHGTGYDVQVEAGVTLHVYGLQYDPNNSNIVGAIDPLPGDRAVYDVAGYPARHTNDTDTNTGIHHTIGVGADQAAAGNHTHAHTALTSVSADQHHAEDHDHDGSPTQKLIQANTHQSADTDSAPTAIHHTLGTGANQSAAGNHSHVLPGHTIQDEGAALTDRANLNFTGAGVTASDDAGNGATVVDIPGQISFSVYNETQTGDGSTTIFYLMNMAAPGTIRVYIDGIRQPASDDTSPTDVVTFTTAPAIGALLMFDYEMEIA